MRSKVAVFHCESEPRRFSLYYCSGHCERNTTDRQTERLRVMSAESMHLRPTEALGSSWMANRRESDGGDFCVVCKKRAAATFIATQGKVWYIFGRFADVMNEQNRRPQ